MNFRPGSKYSAEEFLLANAPEVAETTPPPPSPPRKSRVGRLAVLLALATVLSTFWAGVAAWEPIGLFGPASELGSMMPFRRAVLANWMGGLQFALGVMAILVAHEFGHYVLTIIYRVPSTPPLFIPFPLFSPIGTMGAVILMHSGTADRRQIFDIGLAGPLAGLVVAIPIIIYGILHQDPIQYTPSGDTIYFGQPLLIQWLAMIFAPGQAEQFTGFTNAQVSPLLMAGWVGLFVTGLNMVPMGQLDGGHVAFGLLGAGSYRVAVGALIGAIGYMIWMQATVFLLMLVLVVLMGLRHPPSSDDSRSLGLTRQIVGWLSLSLPILCIPARPFVVL